VTHALTPTKSRLISAFSGPSEGSPPIWLMRQAGRYLPEYRAVRAEAGSFLDLCYSPRHAVEVALQPLRRFDLDAAILFSDILVIPDGLGQTVRFDEGVGPVLMRLEKTGDFARLSLGRMERHLEPVYETVSLLRDALPADKALIGFSGAPWTLATYMMEGRSSREFQIAKYWAYMRSDDFARLIGVLVEAVALHLLAQVKAGADVLQIFDTWAGVFDDWGFGEWVEKPIAAVIRKVRAKYPNIPILVFARGAGQHLDGFAARIGADGLALDWSVPLSWGRDVLQKQTLVQGNLDPGLLRLGGAPMERAVSAIVDSWRGGRFIFNLGHGILPDTPPQHVEAMIRLIRTEAHAET